MAVKKKKPTQSKLVRLPASVVEQLDGIRSGLPAYYVQRGLDDWAERPMRDVDIIALALVGLRRRVEESKR